MATYTDNYNLTKPTLTEVADVRVINSNMDTVDEIMHGSQVSIADAYDPTQTYDVDDMVMNGFLLYKCITAVSNPEAFDPTKWERTTAVAEGGGGGNANERVLHKAQYDALTPAEQMNGTTYYIDDWAGGAGSNFSVTELYKASDATQVNSITLSQAITDFDLVYVDFRAPVSNNGTFNNAKVYEPNHIIGQHVGATDDIAYLWYTFDSATALSFYSKSQDTTYYIDGIYGLTCGRNEGSDDYSLTESVVGTFLGQTRYRKVIDFGSLPQNASKSVAHGISNIAYFTRIEAVAYESTYHYYLPIPFVDNGNNSNLRKSIYVDSTNVNIQTYNSDTTDYKCFVILEYVKSS